MTNDVITKGISLIESSFAKYIERRMNRERFEQTLANVLSSLPFSINPKRFEVSISNENGAEPFYGCRIFPVIPELQNIMGMALASDKYNKMTYKELYEKWKTIDSWYIEIDSQIFNRHELGLNACEFTAILLHEIGHTVQSDSKLEVWYRAYQEARARASLEQRAGSRVLRNIFTIPLALTCTYRSWTNGKNEVNVEKFADTIVLNMGYGEHLVNAINKIIRAYGNSDMKTKDQQVKEVESSIHWCMVNTAELAIRRDAMKDKLIRDCAKTKSKYMANLSNHVIKDTGIQLQTRLSGAVVESTIEILQDPEFINNYRPIWNAAKFSDLTVRINAAIESARNEYQIATEGKGPQFPSQYDIDAIAVEIDKITNHHDRIFVLDLIYDVFDRLEKFETYNEKNTAVMRDYGMKIAAMRDELNMLRKAVLDKKKLSSDYKLFVRYPEGYEG